MPTDIEDDVDLVFEAVCGYRDMVGGNPKLERRSREALKALMRLSKYAHDGSKTQMAYSQKQFASLFGVSETFVKNAIRRRALRHIKLGHRTLVPQSEISRVLKEGL